MNAAMVKAVQIVVRVERATVALADEIVELMGKSSLIKPSRTAVFRLALERGLAELFTELGGKKRKP
jgi:hypothetical protein